MPTATLPSLTDEQVDDLLYSARTGQTSELKSDVDAFAKGLSKTPSSILAAAVDPESRNGLLHYASANGHLETLKELLSISSTSPALNTPNASGNTPLHWAALNGNLVAVKLLVAQGADVTIINNAGHDAVYEAEANDKNEVAEWLLKESKTLETGIGRSTEGDEIIDANASNEEQLARGGGPEEGG